MNYGGIKDYDIANGPGIRLSLFVSGCRHHCKGCFNAMTWDFNYGEPYTKEVEDDILKKLGQECYQGLTLLGGEPMEPEKQKCILPLVRRFKEMYPKKDLWCFTGFLFDKDLLGWMSEELYETPELLKYIDILVDGKFILEKKDVRLVFKGSSNQRTIDVQKSLKEGKICFWNPFGVATSKSARI